MAAKKIRSFVLAGAGLLAGAAPGCSFASDDDAASNDSAISTCPTGPTLRGVDVSEFQGQVDWPTAKASGLTFAFARVSDGTQKLDDQFAANWPAMLAQGLVRGAYQFFRPNEDPIAQAD